jgi:hypothetical protein
MSEAAYAKLGRESAASIPGSAIREAGGRRGSAKLLANSLNVLAAITVDS